MMYITDGLSAFLLIFHLKFFEEITKTMAIDDNRIDQNMSLHPYFDFDVPRNITARLGQTAFLHCRVEQLGDKSVSWIRKRDLHILTAGILTYTSDERFQVIRPENSESWTLQIKFSQARDSGIYECQVNTEPKMSMAFRLNIVEAKAVVVGPTDIYVKTGSEVILTCIVSQGPHELGTIFWYRGSTSIPDQTSSDYHINDIEYPGRITVDTKWTDALRSRLKISAARLSDSGNYSCMPTTAEGASVTVHIINGEHPAAMQRGCATNNLNLSTLLYIITLSLLLQQLNRIVHGHGIIAMDGITDRSTTVPAATITTTNNINARKPQTADGSTVVSCFASLHSTYRNYFTADRNFQTDFTKRQTRYIVVSNAR